VTDTPYEPTLDDVYANNSIYIHPKQQKYGFRININHPEVHPYYVSFKKKIKEPLWCPLEDSQRYRFEKLILHGYYPIQLQRRK
jgi:hypothetical protein